jgi:hypothetical protein
MSHLHYAGQRGKQAPGAQEEISSFAELAESEMRKKSSRREIKTSSS